MNCWQTASSSRKRGSLDWGDSSRTVCNIKINEMSFIIIVSHGTFNQKPFPFHLSVSISGGHTNKKLKDTASQESPTPRPFSSRHILIKEIDTCFTAFPCTTQSVQYKIKPASIKFFLKVFAGPLIRSLLMGTRRYKTLERLRYNYKVTSRSTYEMVRGFSQFLSAHD